MGYIICCSLTIFAECRLCLQNLQSGAGLEYGFVPKESFLPTSWALLCSDIFKKVLISKVPSVASALWKSPVLLVLPKVFGHDRSGAELASDARLRKNQHDLETR